MYAEEFKPQIAAARAKLEEMARKHLREVKHEVRIELGHPAKTIIDLAERLPADLLVMTSHRRRFARLFLGSIAEDVMLGTKCPVLTAKNHKSDRLSVASWMSADPVTVTGGDSVAEALRLMKEGNFRSLPVMKEGKLTGIVTDRDLRTASGKLDDLKVEQVMSHDLFTITSDTSIVEASRQLADHKIGAMPVVDDGKFVGIISSEDILKAFAEVR